MLCRACACVVDVRGCVRCSVFADDVKRLKGAIDVEAALDVDEVESGASLRSGQSTSACKVSSRSHINLAQDE